MLIPSSGNRSRQMRVSHLFLFGSAAMLLFLVLASSFLSANFFTAKVDRSELDNLRNENQKLSTRYEELRWSVAELEDRYGVLVEKEKTLRTAFDLPEINIEQRQLGIGGPLSPAGVEVSNTERIAYSTGRDIDRLLRLSEFELEKYREVEESMTNLRDRLAHTPSIWPTKGWLSRGYGKKYDPFTGYRQLHRGLDIANHRGTIVVASASGRIKSVSTKTGLGKLITISHGYGFVTRYGHLSEIQVKRGQRVKRGDVIGLMGSTGYSTGPHLHYEVIRNNKHLNPARYILNDM